MCYLEKHDFVYNIEYFACIYHPFNYVNLVLNGGISKRKYGSADRMIQTSVSKYSILTITKC